MFGSPQVQYMEHNVGQLMASRGQAQSVFLQGGTVTVTPLAAWSLPPGRTAGICHLQAGSARCSILWGLPNLCRSMHQLVQLLAHQEETAEDSDLVHLAMQSQDAQAVSLAA